MIDIDERLTRPFTKEQMKTKKGRGGNTETWVEAHWLIDRLNRVLGIGEWDFSIRSLEQEEAKLGSHKATKATAHVTVRVWLDWEEDAGMKGVGRFRTYDGVGSITMMGDDAVKGAISIAMRQACKYMGVGLHLWTHPGQAAPPEEDMTLPDYRKVRSWLGSPPETWLAQMHEHLVTWGTTELGFGKYSESTWLDMLGSDPAKSYLRWIVKKEVASRTAKYTTADDPSPFDLEDWGEVPSKAYYMLEVYPTL